MVAKEVNKQRTMKAKMDLMMIRKLMKKNKKTKERKKTKSMITLSTSMSFLNGLPTSTLGRAYSADLSSKKQCRLLSARMSFGPSGLIMTAAIGKLY